MGMVPLSISPSNVIKAAFFPPILKTFVAPGLFDPSVLGSGSLSIVHTIMAVEIDPNIYAAVINNPNNNIAIFLFHKRKDRWLIVQDVRGLS